jgi:hypothetical protein
MCRSYATPLTGYGSLTNPSLVSLLAFELFRRWSIDGTPITRESAQRLLDEEFEGPSMVVADVPRYETTIGLANIRYDRGNIQLALRATPVVPIVELAENMRAIGPTLGAAGNPMVRYRLPSCGVLEYAACDAIWEPYIIELKAVNRGFGVRDLRQLLLYSVLLELSGGRNATHTGVLVNPALGEFVAVSLEQVALVASGMQFVELAAHIAEYLVGSSVSG